MFRTTVVVLCGALALTSVAWPLRGAELVTDEQVGQTIEKIKRFLYSEQGKGDFAPGAWNDPKPGKGHENEGQYGGMTALVTLALLVSGESHQKPELAAALEFLREIPEEQFIGTYARGIRSAVWGQLPDAYLPFLEADGLWLIDTAAKHKRGLFDYLQGYSSRVDHSVAQYGVLGLWEAAKRGGKIPDGIWKKIGDHFVASQNPDGGWNYGGGKDSPSYGSMSAAGLASIFIVQQRLHRDDNVPNKELNDAIVKGLEWFDKNFTAQTNPGKGGWHMYYLYGVERIGLAAGFKYFNKLDWYQEGARVIIKRAGSNGNAGGLAESAFALMFLSRGRYPTWISKLQVPGINWNNRPMDLHFLSDYLSDYREAELNWQVVHIDTDPTDWINAPLLYIASDDELNLTDEQKANLRRYIDFGGTLFFTPDNGSERFLKSAQNLLKEMYPDYTVGKLADDDPVLEVQNPLERGAAQPLMAMSNGVRNLAYIATRDWAFDFQTDKTPGKSPPWLLMTNIWAMVTNRGMLPNRLERRFVHRQPGEPRGLTTIARLQYEGNFDPEPGAWAVVGNNLFNRAGTLLEATPIKIADLPASSFKLAHLAGVGEVTLSDADLQALQQFTQQGGTLLVETVGGRGNFTQGVERQLTTKFGGAAIPLAATDQLVSGENLPGGPGSSARRVTYRRYAVVNMALGTRPRLAALIDPASQRPLVVFSGEDLSLGAIGAHHWNIAGYEHESALNIMTNFALLAAPGPVPAPEPAPEPLKTPEEPPAPAKEKKPAKAKKPAA